MSSRHDVTAILIAFVFSLPFAPAVAQEGDAARGARVYQLCYACHSLKPGEHNLQGPNLYGVVGRKAGTVDGFRYSGAMKAKAAEGLVWTSQALDRYLSDPETRIPGTAMAVNGIRDPVKRADLIAYLKEAGGTTD